MRPRKPIPCKRAKPRKGRRHDPDFLAFVATEPCMVTGRWPVTVHHVREHGAPKDDREVVPLIAELHQIQFGNPHCVEKLGRVGFQEYHGVSFPNEIRRLNAAYETKR